MGGGSRFLPYSATTANDTGTEREGLHLVGGGVSGRAGGDPYTRYLGRGHLAARTARAFGVDHQFHGINGG